MITSQKRANTYSAILFLVGLGILALTSYWWPGMMLIVGLPLAVRQYLLGRSRDSLISLLVFVGAWVTLQFYIPWDVLLPTLFTLGALYVFVHEFFAPESVTEEEREEDLSHELDEKK